jgi:Zn-dependent oligopeptidase
MDKLTQFKRKETHNQTALFEAWDFGYFAGRYDEEVLNFNSSEVSDYFPTEVVVEQTLQIY